MNSFCFVILNYVTTDDTIDCVKSIIKNTVMALTIIL